ncbi:MAG: hypothetical protein R3Y50_01345 [Rikenellaceae bacterium]
MSSKFLSSKLLLSLLLLSMLFLPTKKSGFAFAAQSTLRQTEQKSDEVVVKNRPEISVRLSRDSIMIGDQVDLIVTVKKDITQLIALPEVDAKSGEGKVETLSGMVVDTIAQDNRTVTLEARQKLTSFERGIYTFKEIPVVYIDKNINDTIYSDSVKLYVETYLIDTATYQMADLKPLMKEPFTFDELKYYMRDIFSSIYTYIGLVLVLIIAAIIWYIRYRKRKNVYVRPAEPPHVTAIRTLEQIAHEKVWENGRYKEYYTRLTDAIRIYLVGRYDINAMEMTSAEIFDALAEIDINGREVERVKELLYLSDYVKFAKATPSNDDCRSSYDNAYFFVEETKLLPMEVKEEGDMKDAVDIVKPNSQENSDKEEENLNDAAKEEENIEQYKPHSNEEEGDKI